MNIYKILGIVIPNLITNYVFMSFLGMVSRPRFFKKIYTMLYVGILGIQCLTTSMQIPFLSLMTFLGIATVLTIWGYEECEENRKFSVVFFICYLTLIDMVAVPAYAQIAGITVEETLGEDFGFFITGIISATIMICTYKVAAQLIVRRKVSFLTKKQEIFILFLGVFELLTMALILRVENYQILENNVIAVWMFSGFIIIDIYILSLFEEVSANNELKLENTLLEQEQYMNLRYIEQAELQNENYRRIMHDIRKHIQVLEQTEGIDKEYCSQILKTLDQRKQGYRCTDSILNIIINDILLLCEEKNIDMQIDMEDIEFSFMNKMDITTIFMNLLNNAVEACSEPEVQERYIKLIIKKIKNSIVVIVKNRYSEEKQIPFSEGISTKKGHMGLGISNVRKTLKKYDAELVVENENGEFVVKFVIDGRKGAVKKQTE